MCVNRTACDETNILSGVFLPAPSIRRRRMHVPGVLFFTTLRRKKSYFVTNMELLTAAVVPKSPLLIQQGGCDMY